MKKFILVFSCILVTQLLIGQKNRGLVDITKNNFYGEIHVGFFSQLVLNIETEISSRKKVTWYSRFGVGSGASFYGGDILDASSGLGGLGAITMLRGKKNSHFELNAGAFLGIDHSESVPFIFPILNICYRYQKPRSRFIFRVNAGIGSVGLSFGKAF